MKHGIYCQVQSLGPCTCGAEDELATNAARYRWLRTLNPIDYAYLHKASLEGHSTFDELVDRGVRSSSQGEA